MTRTLEAIYLSIVIPYINDIRSVKVFQLVNKKCFDSIGMIRINPWFTPQGNYIQWHDAIKEVSSDVMKTKELDQEIQLFRSIQTIQTDLDTIKQRKEIIEAYNCIRIKYGIIDSNQFILDSFKEKLVELRVIIKKPICIDFKEFIQLKRIKLISINVKLNLFQFFTKKNQKFDWVYVNLTQNIELFINQIDDYEIKKFVIETRKLNGINILNKQRLSNKVIVCCNEWIENKEAIVNYQDTFLYSSRKKNMNEAMKLYYPYSIELSWLYNENEMVVDLSSFTNIIQIKQQFKPKQEYYYPSSLKMYDGCSLKNIPNSLIYLYLSDVVESITIPSYIISLKLENIPHWTIADKNCINSLKLITDINDKLPYEVTKLKNMKVMHLTNCIITNTLTVLTRLNKLRLSQCKISLNSNELPSSLSSIICRNCKTKYCFLPSSLVSLQILGMKSMEETPFYGFIFHSQMKLQQLSNDTGINITNTPTTITYLSIKNYSNNELLNLKNLSLLNVLGISNSSSVTIIIPSKLKELYCFSSIVTIQNPNESLLEGMYFKSCKMINWSSVPKLIKHLLFVPTISLPLNQKDYPNLKFHKSIIPNSQSDLFISQGLPNTINERRPLISKMDIKIIDN
ncbi:hypothetical protein ENUP19_0080G0061 [Entamoeba nuttalli]|uniref:Leucine-rich repeat containing protein n=2 Tax=Entamoeba nuttalli TaxID=412467 RepID=K2H4A4_ENTNP|nr:hypothetical protein ENU1_202400 [Entamoeba nuttalli P19]EKE37299.1 hypothetical protein ENU1_202400 [Entamoeba nuttalli P19]|eukprot:XP_008860367.1 hypothetical protein ENU1_202400 [Entamoeba nuttalli P19]